MQRLLPVLTVLRDVRLGSGFFPTVRYPIVPKKRFWICSTFLVPAGMIKTQANHLLQLNTYVLVKDDVMFRDVQLLIACCIADILRIFAPEAPYKEPAQIKTIFLFIIRQLGGLKDPKVRNRYY
jgi:hypothetical protein